MRTLAIMQPYLFPYIGYYQLIYAADKIVFYDDVNYIKGGWINRNRILVNGNDHMFTLPLAAPSPNRKINEIMVDDRKFATWTKKFLTMLQQVYGKAPFFEVAFVVVSETFNSDFDGRISSLAKKSVLTVMKYLDVEREFCLSSEDYQNQQLRSQGRVIDICIREKADVYINLYGGKELYEHSVFKDHGITLKFIKPALPEYRQGKLESFLPGLSIVDILMFNSRTQITEMLKKCSFE